MQLLREDLKDVPFNKQANTRLVMRIQPYMVIQDNTHHSLHLVPFTTLIVPTTYLWRL